MTNQVACFSLLGIESTPYCSRYVNSFTKACSQKLKNEQQTVQAEAKQIAKEFTGMYRSIYEEAAEKLRLP